MMNNKVMPWDLLNPRTEYVSKEESETRMTICRACPRFISLTTQCKECGCIMKAKSTIKYAECPLKKW
jgi:hypothetical protein